MVQASTKHSNQQLQISRDLALAFDACCPTLSCCPFDVIHPKLLIIDKCRPFGVGVLCDGLSLRNYGVTLMLHSNIVYVNITLYKICIAYIKLYDIMVGV